MFDHRIEILRKSQSVDHYNEKHDDVKPVAIVWAQRTEHGGRENLYAGRITTENEVVYTIRFRVGITSDMLVKDEQEILRIVSIHHEGRKYRLHIKCMRDEFQGRGISTGSENIESAQ